MRRRSLLTAVLAAALGACGVREAGERSTPARPTGRGPRTGSGPAPTGGRSTEQEPTERDRTEREPTEREPTEERAGGAVELSLLCRDAWGAVPARGRLGRHTVRRLMVHHDAAVLERNRDAPARLRQHQRFHIEQGWGDIAYHVAVDRRGHAYELRDVSAPGDTATGYDPSGWFLAVALGNLQVQAPTDEQLEGLARVLAWAARRHGAAPAVAAHRDHAATACPGDHMMARLDALTRRTEQLVGRVEAVRLCGASGRERVAAIESGRA